VGICVGGEGGKEEGDDPTKREGRRTYTVMHRRRARRIRVYFFVSVLGNRFVEPDVVEDVGKTVYWRSLIVVGLERRVQDDPLHTNQFNRLLVY
jgi:hypothetical protein